MKRQLFAAIFALSSLCGIPSNAAPASAASPGPGAASAATLQLQTLADGNGRASDLQVGLGDDVMVILTTTATVDPSKYTLFLDGTEISDLPAPRYDRTHHGLVFHLQRNASNAPAWVKILGRPFGPTKSVSVALGERAGQQGAATIFGKDGKPAALTFVIFNCVSIIFGLVTILAALALVWGSARFTTILRDNLIPQVEPKKQTYSLARWQMAVWFSLVFASYVFLFIALGDTNTLNTQALMLMGISSATALAAVAVDAAKDTPTDAVNQGLRLLGLKSFEDVERVRSEISTRQAQLTSKALTPQFAQQLQSEISDRQNLLRTYEDAVRPYISEGWYLDLVTDINGPALHRVQIVCWTLLLGIIFVFEVWQTLAMSEFSQTLLALMAVSGAGYVGFKYPEVQP